MSDRYKEDLEWFVTEMEAKLDENNYKGTWKNDNIFSLFNNLYEEFEELEHEIDQLECGNIDALLKIIKECADVSNFAMMIAERAKSGIK